MAKISDRYSEAVGRRKSAVARVRIVPAARESATVNGKDIAAYFPVVADRARALAPLAAVSGGAVLVSVKVTGGGRSSQAEAVRHGLARALVLRDPELRKRLKKDGFLRRDARAKERRKFGLKKARKAPQWAKR